MGAGLYLTNTLSRKRELFRSREKEKVKLFTCGPSTYSRAHLGNYRTFLYEDVLQRYLEYLGYRVERMINFTDVEDKAIAEAREQGISLKELTGRVEGRLFKEVDLLGIKLPEHIPRASTSVDQAVQLIKILLDKGYAYWHEKDVFYDPLKFEGFGKLYGLDMSRWPKKKRRFHKDTYPGQRWNLGDFILWHGGEGSGVHWDTEIGRGRPAWNIQDAAMITKDLGFTIDIACGGIDNLFRHHDYTLAVIEAVSQESFSTYWLHGQHVLVNGSKMSKSQGNIVYLENLLEKGYAPSYIRFFLIYGHYREQLDLTDENLEKIAGKLLSFKEMIRQLTSPDSSGDRTTSEAQALIRGVEETFKEKMNDDLNVKGAFDGVRKNLSRLMSLKNKGQFTAGDAGTLRRTLEKIDSVFYVLGDQ
ncbi:MAG: class I tRNA ligase family protein [Deltaproteobacteria bacterium]